MFLQNVNRSASTDPSKTSSKGRFDPRVSKEEVGDWLRKGQGPDVVVHDGKTQSLLLVWDDGQPVHAPLQVRVVRDFIDADIVHVFLNDRSIAEVKGHPELQAADVALVPLSVAETIGLTPA